MTFDIMQALSDGFDRTMQKNGLMFAALLAVVGLVNTLLANTFLIELFSQFGMPAGPAMAELATLPISASIAGILWLPAVIVSMVISIAAIRTFVSSETESIPKEYFTWNMPMTILNLFVGGLVFSILLTIGFVFLVIPGIYLLVALYFWTVYVAVEEQNFIDAFKSSWEMTKGNRLALFGIGLVVAIITAVISGIFGIPGGFTSATVGAVFTAIGSGIASTFTVATTAQVYNQLN